MTRVELAPEVIEDFDRIIAHLEMHAAIDVAGRLREIVAALDILQTSPSIGRPAAAGKRELVIGRRSHGYVALYRYVSEIDIVFVLAVRAQREAGFVREPGEPE